MTEKQYYLRKNCLNCQHWQQKKKKKIIGHYNKDKRCPKIGYEHIWICQLHRSRNPHGICDDFVLSDYMKKQIKSMGFRSFEVKEDMVIVND